MTLKYRLLLAVLLTLFALGCQVVLAQTKNLTRTFLIEDRSLSVTLDYLQDKDCYGNNGVLAVTASGGSGTYSFNWSGPSGFTSTSEDLSDLTPGPYQLTVSDGAGCVSTSTWEIKSICPYSCIAYAEASITPASTCNASNGAIQSTIFGGSGSYSYAWYFGGVKISSAKNIAGLKPGVYELYFTDLNHVDCGSYYAVFNLGSAFSIHYSLTDNAACTPPFSGSIDISVTGGSGNYTYLWNLPDGSTSSKADISGLSGGTYYSLLVTDVTRGCNISESIYLSNLANTLTVAANTITANTNCVNPNGAIDISISGGTGNYSVTWYDQQNFQTAAITEDLTNAKGSVYSVSVVDDNSKCSSFQVLSVPTNTPEINYTVSDVQPSSNCSAPYNGKATLNISGGSGVFDVQWLDGVAIASTAKNPTTLAPGNYGFLITDKPSGCTVVKSVFGPAPVIISDASTPGLAMTVDEVVHSTRCIGEANGAIRAIIATTNNTPYTLQWTGPNGFTSGESEISSLVPGIYTVAVSTYCNTPPVITPTMVTTVKNSFVKLNLTTIVSDPDGNLDYSGIDIAEQPLSRSRAYINGNMELVLDYQGSGYAGIDVLKLRACDLLGACSENLITIEVDEAGEVIVYNAISPNSPADNKFMRIENLPEENRVAIFNRWGDKVYETSNYDNDTRKFDGQSLDGKNLPTGTYFYEIELPDGKRSIQGYLELKWL